MIYLILLPLFALVFTGCGDPPAANFEGLPLSVWLERARSNDNNVQMDALKVIQSIGSPAKQIESSVREIARTDDSRKVRYEAVQALRSMGATIVEFENFVELYEGPVIPLEEVEDYSDVEDWEEFEEEQEMMEHASGADDIEVLKALVEGRFEENVRDSQTMPKDSVELADWIGFKQSEAVTDLLQYLKNPMVLREILTLGNSLEREFAARKLSEMTGNDAQVIRALEDALDDPENPVRQAAKKALDNWKLP